MHIDVHLDLGRHAGKAMRSPHGEELDELGHAHLTGGRERALLALGSSASTLELDDRLVNGGTLTKPDSRHGHGLADAVHARDGLVLDRRI